MKKYMKKKKYLTIKFEPINLFSHWCHGIKIRLEYIIENPKMTKEDIRNELKDIIKLFQ